MKRTALALLLGLAFAAPGGALAQESPPAAPAAEPAAPPTAEPAAPPAAEPAAPAPEAAKAPEPAAAPSEPELSAQEGDDAGFVPIADDEGAFAEDAADSKLDIYGFADFNYFQLLNSKDSPWIGYRKYGSFFVGHLNLYLSAELAQEWRSLIEVRFSYLPHGDETTDPTTGVSVRQDTSVNDYAEYEKVNRWGSVLIERAWLEYAPFDFLSIRGGLYLTPYGFWNEDHGTPVIIPIQRPFVIGESLFPERQTGLEAHLRAPIDSSTVGLHLTLSNGRGPIDTYQDLDGNKAVGASAYLSTKLLGDLDVGAAVYRGQYTDAYEQYGVDLSGPTPAAQVDFIRTVQYDELSLAANLRFRYEELLFQTEIVMNDVAFNDAYRPESVGLDAEYHAVPDYRRWGAYALIGYRTPWLGLMPYFMYQFNSFADQEMNDPGHGFTPGVNMRPTANVVLKVEYTYAPFEGPGSFGINDEPLQMFASQAAWAF